VAACLALLPGPAARTLVYAYTYESGRSAAAEKAYGVDKMDPGSGGTFMFHNVNQHYVAPGLDASENRRGTLAIEILREEADGGLVLRVSEPPAANAADTAPLGVTCVTFGDTTLVCDPKRTLSPEAAVLLGYLGKNFVDASRLDASGHWHVDTAGSYGASADFTIVRRNAGTVAITERAVSRQVGPADKTDVTASIVYDIVRSLPLTVEASTFAPVARGQVVSESISSHMTLTLVSH